MSATLEANKAVVRRFNVEVIEQGNMDAAKELLAPGFVNRTAPPGTPAGPEGMMHMVANILKPAFPDLKVEIHDQIAEGDKVTTRKTIHATHQGTLMGIAATGRAVSIDVIDIVRIADGKYAEHWGINTLFQLLSQLRS
ncbi:MAG TPA: ester cyclase [Steroidobacteraceae bacterium]|nr:ester cyclase [Steroidobacteraceae bacterium]